jgi:alpha-methylacyl-CoA racemase
MAGLLDGITVLDLASVGPAPRASGWLVDYGASVVKVAPMPTDSARQITPKPHLYSGGRGTRCIRIDLKSRAGRDTFLRLAERADVIVESFRPGVADRLGIGYDEVKGRNQRIVYCSTTGYGQTGPAAQRAGHDLNYLAAGGFLANSERVDGKPALPGATIADGAAGGMQAVIAILAALVARERTGEGAYLDVAVADGVLALMALQADEFLATGTEPQPAAAPFDRRFACYDCYRTADGGWLAVAAIEAKFWANLCRALGLEQYVEAQYDEARQDEIRAALAQAFAAKSRDDWSAELADQDTCVSPVQTVPEALHDPQFTARGAVASATAPSGGFRQLAPMLAGAERAATYDLPDRAATDTDEVLSAAGFAADEIAALRADGVVG